MIFAFQHSTLHTPVTTIQTEARFMECMLRDSFQKGNVLNPFFVLLALLTRSFCSADLSEYGGYLLSAEQARALPPESQAWLRTLSSMFYELDGNPSRFTNAHIEMAQRHVLGSLINHSFRRQNCLFASEEWSSPDVMSGKYFKCIFIRATRNIYAHEQLLISYGTTANGFPHIPF